MPEVCIPWIGYIADDGYGVIRSNGKVWRAHRLMYQRFYGDFNQELCVLHTCDNPLCINPLHLFLGTQGENNEDRKKKGRSSNQYTGGIQILDNEDIYDIHRLREEGWPVIKIANFFGVTRSSIYAVLKEYDV